MTKLTISPLRQFSEIESRTLGCYIKTYMVIRDGTFTAFQWMGVKTGEVKIAAIVGNYYQSTIPEYMQVYRKHPLHSHTSQQ